MAFFVPFVVGAASGLVGSSFIKLSSGGKSKTAADAAVLEAENEKLRTRIKEVCMMKRFVVGVVFAGAVAVGVKKLSEYADGLPSRLTEGSACAWDRTVPIPPQGRTACSSGRAGRIASCLPAFSGLFGSSVLSCSHGSDKKV
ncbi:MAG: hypothetical protein IJU95_06915 [Treponema sp.]|nr:hypothetical protein [Treponema sp.]